LKEEGALDEEMLDLMEHKEFFDKYTNAEDEFKEDKYYKDIYNA
jgi:hypothetical protein